MPLQAKDYVKKLRDSAVENELARQLRDLPEEDRFVFVQELLADARPSSHGAALALTRAVIERKEFLENILLQGLGRGNSSTIRPWLESVVHRLGMRRLLSVLTERARTEPHQVQKTLYWLRERLTRGDQGQLASMNLLERTIAEARSQRTPHTALAMLPSSAEAAPLFREAVIPACNLAKVSVSRLEDLFPNRPNDILSVVDYVSVLIVDVTLEHDDAVHEYGITKLAGAGNAVPIANAEKTALPVSDRKVLPYRLGEVACLVEPLRFEIEQVLQNVGHPRIPDFSSEVELFSLFGQGTWPFILLAFEKSPSPIRVDGRLMWAGHDSYHRLTAEGIPERALNYFLKKGYAVVKDGVISLTAKGMAFGDYLEQLGYILDQVNDQVLTKDFTPFFERLSRIPQQANG